MIILVVEYIYRIIWRKKTLLDFKNIRETAGMFEFSDNLDAKLLSRQQCLRVAKWRKRRKCWLEHRLSNLSWKMFYLRKMITDHLWIMTKMSRPLIKRSGLLVNQAQLRDTVRICNCQMPISTKNVIFQWSYEKELNLMKGRPDEGMWTFER